jgi:REP element-mobilizing transposase RayT
MGHTYASLLYHCIFSTKDRAPVIVPKLAPELFAYMGGIVRSLDGIAMLINGVPDHVHMMIALPATLSVADAMRLVKTNSSKWVHERSGEFASFGWQTGYGAFSVSKSNVPSVEAYIAKQEEHHRTMTFQEEFIAFLKRHGIAYDERYIWE